MYLVCGGDEMNSVKYKIIESRKHYIDILNEYNNMIDNIKNYLQQNKIISYDEYIAFIQFDKEYVKYSWFVNLFNTEILKRIKSVKAIYSEYFNNAKSIVDNHNDNYYKTKIDAARLLIEDVEGDQLDNQQMLSIVHEDYSQLVLAGAGTGKTKTIIGKIKYLIKKGEYLPEDFLVISYTTKTTEELTRRLKDELNANIDVKTFHKLGLDLLKNSDRSIQVYRGDLPQFIENTLSELIQDEEYLRKLNFYLIFNSAPYKSEFEFRTENEYKEYLEVNPPTTLNQETVKSYGEMNIANYLIQNKVNYIYEEKYVNEDLNYYPDFYLPDYKIYIEYFGIDRNNKVPDYFTAEPGKTPSETYMAGINWKRNIHKNNKTILIETYAYENWENDLVTNLESNLIKNNVKLSPMTPKEMWSYILNNDNRQLRVLSEFFGEIISLIKSNNLTYSEFELKNESDGLPNNKILIELIKPVFFAYDKMLEKENSIDFNDMINDAAKTVFETKYNHKYKYIIVDEYQDISKARFNLLKSLRFAKDYKLFCVGDDWQSIYRFSGSDVGLILNFEKYWGESYISKIESTYRFSNILAKLSGDFIMANPVQTRKEIQSEIKSKIYSIANVSGYNEKLAVEFMVQRLDDFEENSTVFFLGRYTFDSDILRNSNLLRLKYDNKLKKVIVIYLHRPDLKIEFMTIHKSKGLEADYVILINNKRKGSGFPSRVQDHPIKELLLDSCDNYPFSEERRLFYVALTRTKKKILLMSIKNNESIFFREIYSKIHGYLDEERNQCPKCGGKLQYIKGPYGDFYGCSNYSDGHGCNYTRKVFKKNNKHYTN